MKFTAAAHIAAWEMMMIILPLFPEGKIKALTFSYDDGTQWDRQLIDIFNRYGMKGTFNFNSINVDPEKLNTVYQGHEISCHGKIHTFLEQLLLASALEDVLEDRKTLEKYTGRIIRGMAYPMGTYSRQIIETLRTAGFAYARTCKATNKFIIPEDFLEWHPTCHHSANGDLDAVATRFLNWNFPFSLCYVWGHSAEFARDKNWDHMENFCRRLAGQENIWYATNMEICEYITAARRLVSSADASRIHNPSAMPVWIAREDGTPVKICPGETVNLN